ncbi:MAG: ABC transporter substrate-binding protein, partial [Myxococcota bacterium]
MRSLCVLVSSAALVLSCAVEPEKTGPQRFGRFRPRKAAELFLHLREDPPHFDPALGASHADAFLAEQLFEGLTSLDQNSLAPIPALATSWTQSEDGRRYRFQLREDARWSDGQPVTAADVVFAWERALRPQTAAVAASSLYAVKGAGSYHRGRRRRILGNGVVARRAPFVLLGQYDEP